MTFCLTILFYGCTKWKYRYISDYLGTWEFQVCYYTMNITLDTSWRDTVYFTGVINRGPGNDEVIIQYTEENNMTLRVGDDGVILDYCMRPSSCSGKFTDDNKFEYRYSARVSTGQSLMFYSREINGEKISDTSTLNQPPVTVTDSVTGIALGGALLNGTVTANYLSTDCYFEYGVSAQYSKKMTASPASVSGKLPVKISCYVTDLKPGTLYHFRAKASNSEGTSNGVDMTFTTRTATESVTDLDGNVYTTVPIDNEIWMAENLRTIRYSNGDIIPTTQIVLQDISKEPEPKYQWVYDGVESNADTYGRLYTWYTVIDTRNICPAGWHVPDWEEVNRMIMNSGQYNGGAFKESGLSHWISPNTDANNATGFTGLPGGMSSVTPLAIRFSGIGQTAGWWTASERTPEYSLGPLYALSFSLQYSSSSIGGRYWEKNSGLSVRCVKD